NGRAWGEASAKFGLIGPQDAFALTQNSTLETRTVTAASVFATWRLGNERSKFSEKGFRIMFPPWEVFYAFRSRGGGHLDFDSLLIPEIRAIFIQFSSLFERRLFQRLTY